MKAQISPQDTLVDFSINLTMFAEDMYNFNPKNKDIKTHIPDEANGRFERTGLAQEFLHVSSFSRIYSFTVPYDDLSTPSFARITNEKSESPRTPSF